MASMKDLFGDTPYPALARHTDLATSKEAAKRVDPLVTKLMNAVAADIRRCGFDGATWNEISRRTGIDKGSISPRFKPLREAGLIRAKTDSEGRTIKREHQTVWIAC